MVGEERGGMERWGVGKGKGGEGVLGCGSGGEEKKGEARGGTIGRFGGEGRIFI